VSLSGSPLVYRLSDKDHEAFGRALHVEIPEAERLARHMFTAVVHYETSPSASAVQWLQPEQTAGKAHPYLFTQCQAIHARSLVPCQDCPSAKVTYSADVAVPAALTALMSAFASTDPAAPAKPAGPTSAAPQPAAGERVFSFVQPVPMPSYLIALAVGNLTSKDIGPRSRVWSEPETVEAGAYEFAETEQFLATGEEIAGPYVWTRYDILLLPPSFPYGGMENPMLTFVTPTLLAGDRSLANVVAHEIAHSWTGNLVTNKFWADFWLNEGCTVMIERKILSRLKGESHFHLEALIGLKALHESVESQGPKSQLTALRPCLCGIDPDDAFSSVPYEKGFNFLVYLENLVGGKAEFEPFFKSYIANFAFRTVTSDDFRSYFEGYFRSRGLGDKLKTIDWDDWLYTPGMPTVSNAFDTSAAEATGALLAKWVDGKGASCCKDDMAHWGTREKVMFLEKAQAHAPVAAELLDALDATYSLTQIRNSEVRFRWQMLQLLSNDKRCFPHVAAFLAEQGRMKFIRPLYRQLAKVDKQFARDTFAKYEKSYHPIGAKMVAKDLA
jgi:leukotriene-A4 hydrolase